MSAALPPASEPGTDASRVRVVRRPVHDRTMQVVAYEVRHDEQSMPGATPDLLLSMMVDLGFDRVAAGRDVVLRVSDDLVRRGDLATLPLERIIVDIPPSWEPDDEVEALLGSARGSGLRLCVPDPVVHPHLAGIADLADVIAVDVAELDREGRRERRRALRRPGRLLLATGVDDHDTHADCAACRYDLFSGTVLSTPNIVSGRRVPSERAALLNLLAIIDDEDVSVDDIELAVASNPALSFQVLRYVNSAFVGLRSEVDSVRRAIVLVGPPVLRQIASMLLVASDGERPGEANRLALVRAHMCALLGEATGDPRPTYHTTGLLSAVDLLTGVALPDALGDLPLTTEVVDALLRHEGHLGRILAAVCAYECADWDADALRAFDDAVLAESYVRAIGWADERLDAGVARVLGAA